MQFLRSLAARASSVRWPALGSSVRPVGADLGAASAKLVALSRGYRDGVPRWRLEAAELLPWPAHVVDAEGRVLDPQAGARLLEPLVDTAGWRGRGVVAAMPAHAITARRLQVPEGLSERDLELEVQLQLEPVLPYPLEQACVDFVREGKGCVRAVAAARNEVQARCSLLEQAGLRVLAMDLASDALRRAATHAAGMVQAASAKRHPGVTALIDIGVQAARIQVVWGERVLHEREQPGLGARSLESMSLKDAAQALSGVLSLFFDGRVQGLQDIVLSGAGAMRAGLVQAMQAHNLCNCEVLQPFGGMRMSEAVDRARLAEHASAFSLACGLALRDDAAGAPGKVTAQAEPQAEPRAAAAVPAPDAAGVGR